MSTLNDSLKNFADHSFGDPIGFNKVPGLRRVAALGNSPALVAPSDIWSGNTLYPFKTSATTMEVISTSTSDTSAGVGARTVLVNGLDANYVEVSEIVTLNGTSEVAMVNTYIAINNAFLMLSGSSSVNIGDISIRDSGGGTVRAIIPAGYGITRSSVYTVPAGHTLSVHSIFACINRTAGGGQTQYATISNGQKLSNGTMRLPFEFSISSNTPYLHEGVPGIIAAEKSTFFLRCVANSATIDLTAAWLGKLRKND